MCEEHYKYEIALWPYRLSLDCCAEIMKMNVFPKKDLQKHVAWTGIDVRLFDAQNLGDH